MNSPGLKPPPRGPSRRALLALIAWLALAPDAGAFAAGEAPPATPADAADRATFADLVQRGNTLRQAGRLQEAVDAYRSAAALDAKRYEPRILVADTLRRMGKADEAVHEYLLATAIDPTRSEGYTGRALIRRGEFDFTAAADIIRPGLAATAGSERAALLVSLAETRRREDRAEEAATLFRSALDDDPSSAPAHAGLARLAEARGDFDTALDEMDLYLALRPDDAAVSLRRDELREMRTSIAALRAAATEVSGRSDSSSTIASVQAELGRLLSVAGDAPGAVTAYRAALRADSTRVESRRGLALALVAAGDPKAAASEFRRLLRSAPADGTALYHMAAIARARGDLRAEETAWEELIRRRPDDLHGLRASLIFLERAGSAARMRALQLAGADASIAGKRRSAVLYAAQHSWPEAEEALYRALLADSTDPWTLELAGDLLARRPELLAALGARALAELGPENSAATTAAALPLALLARCHALAGRTEQALTLARRAAAADPSSAVAGSAFAEALQSAGEKPERVLALLTRAADLDRSRLAPQVDLTLALLRSGKAQEAEASARRSLEHLPDAAPLLSLLGAALAERGRSEEAARAYTAALVADPADNFHLARGQLPLTLAALGRTVEARHALEGAMPQIPDLLYDEAWAFTRDVSRDRDYVGENWESWRNRYRGRLETPAAARRAIAVMLKALGDPYARLRDPDETATVYLTRHGGRPQTDPLGRNRPSGPTVVAEQRAGGLGYIQIANLTDPNAVAEVRKALLSLGGATEIVLDLRGNPGGLSRSADAVADMLIGPGRTAGIDRGPEGESPRVTGGEGALTSLPITVLVDGQTASAAERLASGLESTGRATLVGGTTRGKGLFQNARVLPGGCTVLVSAGEALGPDGRPIQGRGVGPRPQRPGTPAESPQP